MSHGASQGRRRGGQLSGEATGPINYAKFLEAGYSVGSGIVEGANKLVVEARMKGSGMHWDRDQANAMLALRSALLSGRWDPEVLVRMYRIEGGGRSPLAGRGIGSGSSSPDQPTC
ncbi:MAG: hypothetical protein HW416_600 [Chloroflexi bacterium]|nr:hypothetical protein [Chloroflexota bacterium]